MDKKLLRTSDANSPRRQHNPRAKNWRQAAAKAKAACEEGQRQKAAAEEVQAKLLEQRVKQLGQSVDAYLNKQKDAESREFYEDFFSYGPFGAIPAAINYLARQSRH
jgi:hypothetical protein